jgi:thiopeptide-type bacteriocin biosynthesis protein
MRNDWISVYIYSDIEFELVISSLISTIINELKNMNYLESYFFIRYWENGEHIRLRILATNNNNNLVITQIVENQAKSFFSTQQNCKHYRIEYVPYIPEITRYAGEHGMRLSEQLFEYSSKAVIAIIIEYYTVWNNKLAMAFAIKMHVIFAMTMIGKPKIIADIFKGISENWIMHSVKQNELGQATSEQIEKVRAAFEKTYQEQRERIIRIVEDAAIFDKEEPESSVWEPKWAKYCQDIYVRASSQGQLVPVHLAQFCDNHVHMTNNRLGVYLRDESFIAFMLYKVFSR